MLVEDQDHLHHSDTMKHILEHGHSAETLWGVLQRVLHVLYHSCLPDGFLDPALSLDIVRIRVQSLNFALLRGIRLSLSILSLAEELCEASRVRLGSSSYLGLRLC